MTKKIKSLAKYAAATTLFAVTAFAFFLWRINPAHTTTAEEVNYQAFQTLGARPGKIKLIGWLRARGFEIDEKDYQKNGNVIAILRDTKWGVPQTDIYFTLLFDYSKIDTDNPQCLGHSIEERIRFL